MFVNFLANHKVELLMTCTTKFVLKFRDIQQKM